MRDFYLCYPAILTNTLVPQLGLSSILQNQLGVALDALTGSRTVHLGSMVTGDGGHDVYPGSGPLYGGNTLLLLD